MNKPSIGVNVFVRRQTAESEFTSFEGTLDEVAALAFEFFDDAKPGYKDGVCLVPVPAEGFVTGIIELQDGDPLVGSYKARRPGEEPRKSFRVPVHGTKDLGRGPFNPAVMWEKSPAVAVDVVLYRKDVLAEGQESA